jgi:uncharacterized protein
LLDPHKYARILPLLGSPEAQSSSLTRTNKLPLFPAVYLVTVVGPGVAGILLSGLAGGWARLRELRSRLLRWRVGARWYAVAILTAPLSTVAALLALSLVSPEFVPGFFTTSVGASLLRFGFRR